MKITRSLFSNQDIQFIIKMHYEAVFWRDRTKRPSFEDSLQLDEIQSAIKELGQRRGDLAVVARKDQAYLGAAWVRYWTDQEHIRGFIDPTIPVLVIGIAEDHRGQGIGEQVLNQLILELRQEGIRNMSLCVSKDNYALRLYKNCGFLVHEDIGDSFLMVRDI